PATTQATSGAVRIAVAQVIWSSPAGTPAPRPPPGHGMDRTAGSTFQPPARPWIISPSRGPAGSQSAARPLLRMPISRSADPELVDEQTPEGVELVVADPVGEHDQRALVVKRDPRGLAGDRPVDVRPEQPGGVGRAGLGGEGLPVLGFYPRVAEFAVVQVGGIARKEGVAAEQQPEEVPGRRVILSPAEFAYLNVVA